MLKSSKEPARVEEFIRELADSFSYSNHGKDAYGDVLLSLERRPADLYEAVEAQFVSVEKYEGLQSEEEG